MKDITKHVLNSIIAGLLVFFGSAISELTDHGLTDFSNLLLGLILAFAASTIVFLTKIQTLLTSEDKQGKVSLLSFF